MATDNRPLSPHLQIYKPQLTSVLSITHRGTGMLLTAGAFFFEFLVVSACQWSTTIRKPANTYLELVRSMYSLCLCILPVLSFMQRHTSFILGRRPGV